MKELLITVSVPSCTANRAEPTPFGELFAVKLQFLMEVVNPAKVPRTPPVPAPVFAVNLHVQHIHCRVLHGLAGSLLLPSDSGARASCD